MIRGDQVSLVREPNEFGSYAHVEDAMHWIVWPPRRGVRNGYGASGHRISEIIPMQLSFQMSRHSPDKLVDYG